MAEHKMVTVDGVRYRQEDAPSGSGRPRPSAAVVPEPVTPDAPAAGRTKPATTKTAGGRKRGTGDADGS